MKRSGGVALVAVGLVLIAFGLLFLAAAAGQSRRLLIGVAGLGLGAVAVGYGIRSYKRADAESPEQIRAEILELAKRRNGEITSEDIAALLGRRAPRADAVLATLMTIGQCRSRATGGSVHYIFPELQPRLMVQHCEYCDTDFEIAEAIDKCPNCGGVIATKVASFSVADGEVFSMDE